MSKSRLQQEGERLHKLFCRLTRACRRLIIKNLFEGKITESTSRFAIHRFEDCECNDHPGEITVHVLIEPRWDRHISSGYASVILRRPNIAIIRVSEFGSYFNRDFCEESDKYGYRWSCLSRIFRNIAGDSIKTLRRRLEDRAEYVRRWHIFE